MSCPHCKSDAPPLAISKKPAVSAAGILSLLVMLAGLVLLMIGPWLGLGVIIIGLALGLARPTRTVLICPDCKKTR